MSRLTTHTHTPMHALSLTVPRSVQISVYYNIITVIVVQYAHTNQLDLSKNKNWKITLHNTRFARSPGHDIDCRQRHVLRWTTKPDRRMTKANLLQIISVSILPQTFGYGYDATRREKRNIASRRGTSSAGGRRRRATRKIRDTFLPARSVRDRHI